MLVEPLWVVDDRVEFLLAVAASVPEWQRDAACAEDQPGADWFPDRGHGDRLRAARAVCRACLVQADCLGFALDEGIEEGVWGGASVAERKQLRRRGVTGEMVRRYGVHVDAGREAERDLAAFGEWDD